MFMWSKNTAQRASRRDRKRQPAYSVSMALIVGVMRGPLSRRPGVVRGERSRRASSQKISSGEMAAGWVAAPRRRRAGSDGLGNRQLATGVGELHDRAGLVLPPRVPGHEDVRQRLAAGL